MTVCRRHFEIDRLNGLSSVKCVPPYQLPPKEISLSHCYANIMSKPTQGLRPVGAPFRVPSGLFLSTTMSL